MTSTTTADAARTAKLRAVLPVLLDLVIPTAGYFILHGLGVGDFWALTIAGLATGVNAVVNTVRRKRLDSLGVLVILEIALSIALFFVTRDPRIVLLKPCFYLALGGLYGLMTCFRGRPLMYDSAKPMATEGDPDRTVAYERAWEQSAVFRRGERVGTAAFGLAILLDAVARAIVVYRFPVTDSVLLQTAPDIVFLVLGGAVAATQVRKVKRVVNALHQEVLQERAAAQPG